MAEMTDEQMQQDIDKQIDRLEQMVDFLQKKSTTIIHDIESLAKDIKSAKFSLPNIKKEGWAKEAKKLGSDSAIDKALAEAETKGSRGAVEAALKLVEKKKGLEPVAKAIRALLKADEDGEKKLQPIVIKAQQVESEVKAAENAVHGLKIEKV